MEPEYDLLYKIGVGETILAGLGEIIFKEFPTVWRFEVIVNESLDK